MPVTTNFEEEIKKAIQMEPVLNVAGRKMASPPVFVKLDRYRELLEDIQNMRSYTLGLRDALDAMGELEKEFKTAMGITNKVLDKLNIIISSIDMKLMKRSGETTEDILGSIKPPPEIEEYIRNIYEQIEKLKSELQALS
jgi:Mg2+ and Co2+ transporter CorA